MRRLGIAAMLVWACGPSQPTGVTIPGSMLDSPGSAASVAPPDAATEVTPAPTAAAPAVLSPAQACTRIRSLYAATCEWTDRFPPDFFDGSNCEATVASWVAPTQPDHAISEALISCWALECEAAVPCMVAANQARPPAAPRTCGEEGATAVVVDAPTWNARRGKDVTKFSQVKTTEQQPIEVCDIDGEVAWMKRVTCNDGSNPYQSEAEINERRDGWFARGGRCNSILDRYTVPCPEATYTIHIDRYVCPSE